MLMIGSKSALDVAKLRHGCNLEVLMRNITPNIGQKELIG